MKTFDSILLPLHYEPLPSPVLKLAVWFATQLKSRVHLVCFGKPPESDRDLFESLGVPDAHGLITVSRAHGDFTREVMLESERISASLIFIASELAQALPFLLDAETQSILERAEVPVLLVPPKYEGRLPWRSILVPMSGETEENPALKMALDLGNAFRVKVDIIYVEGGAGASHKQAPSPVSSVSDQMHHEYPQRIDNFISQASPFSTIEEKHCIRRVSLCRGDVSEEILKEVALTKPDLVAVQWKGRFMEGHARTLKRLIREVTGPILFVKPPLKRDFTLKVA